MDCVLADMDGNAEDRRGTVSVFNGPAPVIQTFDDPEQEAEAIGAWISGRVEQGVQPHGRPRLEDRHRIEEAISFCQLPGSLDAQP